jgi:hypothetical protein
LEDDACDHDVCSGSGVTVFLIRCGGGHGAADGLNDEGDNVARNEYPEVDSRAEG